MGWVQLTPTLYKNTAGPWGLLDVSGAPVLIALNSILAGDQLPLNDLFGNPIAPVEVPDVEITAWQAYTPTTQGLGAISNVEFAWRRVGQCYEVKGRFTTGTVSGDEAQIGLPNGATVGTQISASGVFRVGSIARNNNAGPNAVIATPGDAFVNLAYEGSSPWGLTPRAGNSVLASIELVSFDFSVPIAGL